MRIVHLIDAASQQACPTTLALINDALGRLGDINQHVVLLGGQSLQRDAKQVGIANPICHPVPLGQAWAGTWSIRRILQPLGTVDLIHCWSPGSLFLARLTHRNIPRILTLTQPPSQKTVRWLRILTQNSHASPRPPGTPGTPGTTILTTSHTLRRSLLVAGIPQDRVHVLGPSLDMSKIAGSQRQALRKGWQVDEQTKVVALLTDPPTAGDALKASLAVYLANDARKDSNSTIKLLVHHDQLHRKRAHRQGRELDYGDRHLADFALACPWSVLPGCDLALATGSGGGGLSLLWAMAGNVPIVAEASYAMSEVVEDRHSALLARPDEPAALARRLVQLVDDPQLAWQLRDTARHEAYSFYSRQRYCQNLQMIYQQVLDHKAIEIPPLPVTGGLRFAGRA